MTENVKTRSKVTCWAGVKNIKVAQVAYVCIVNTIPKKEYVNVSLVNNRDKKVNVNTVLLGQLHFSRYKGNETSCIRQTILLMNRIYKTNILRQFLTKSDTLLGIRPL